jgi:hypothetical protein
MRVNDNNPTAAPGGGFGKPNSSSRRSFLKKSLLATAAGGAASFLARHSEARAEDTPKKRDLDVVAIYFPSWHANPHYESWWA